MIRKVYYFVLSILFVLGIYLLFEDLVPCFMRIAYRGHCETK